VLGKDRPPREVGLAARRGPVLAAQRLGGALTEEVDFEGGVYGHEAVFARDVARIICVVDGPELHARVLLHEHVQSPASKCLGGDDLVPVGAFTSTRDDALLDEIDEPVGERASRC
jgi:hypothetical protein